MAGGREITGRQVAAFTVAAFAVIVAVNLVLAWQAVRTFPGLEVRNSYVASQGWDAARRAQAALGWHLAHDLRDGALVLRFTDAAGDPAPVADLRVLVGRTTTARDDVVPVFQRVGGAFVAPLALAPGRWMLRVEATAEDGTPFRQRLVLTVRGPGA